jgi:surfeit locus 1 family protein
MKRALMAVLLLSAAVLFAALGVWQIERRAWKLALIAAVEQRAEAPPQPAPGPPAWPGISAQADAYTHVQVRGTLLDGQETLVQAVTELGPGFWVMTPLRADDGWTVLVNRGFVPDRSTRTGHGPAGSPDPLAGPATVTGLLRLTEPGGGFLRSNDPGTGRWYSRDVAAISRARGLEAAPYFIDADSTPNPGGYPVGGLTVIAFPNSHLVYVFTWFILSGLSLSGLWVIRRVNIVQET